MVSGIKKIWVLGRLARFLGLLSCVVALAVKTVDAQEVSLSPTFGGESFAFQLSLTGRDQLTLDDSGAVPTKGGLSQNSLWDPSPFGILGRGFYAMSDGTQGVNHSSSTITFLDIMVCGHRLVTQDVAVNAFAKAEFLGVSSSGTTTIVQLELDDQRVTISAAPNQRIEFPGGYLLINEQQISGDGRANVAIKVNGLHLVVYGKADMIVCSSRAEVTRPPSRIGVAENTKFLPNFAE
jgi:hypothetical protein